MRPRVRVVAAGAAIGIISFASGALISRGSASPGAIVATSPSPQASPTQSDEPIEIAPESEPYPYEPAPPQRPSPVDGFYMRVLTIEQMGGHQLGMPFHCLRCVPYSVDAGVQTLLLHEGRYFLEHQLNRFRALGHFVVRGGRIAFYNDANCSQIRGSYEWELATHELTLEVIDDSCPYVDERSNDLTLAPWTKIDACFTGIKEWYPALVGC